MSIREIRNDYSQGELNEEAVGDDPHALFQQWMDTAVAEKIPEPNAMTLSTVDANGRPSSRIVLLRGFGPSGFEFYTNYGSRKAQGIETHGFAAILFFWQQLERQVRIAGPAARISAAESDAYFRSRPHRTRLGAIASSQSAELTNREELERAVADLEASYPEGTDVPRPDSWGGYRIVAEEFEFWQGRPNRLHDRFQFTGLADGSWQRRRLWP